MLSNIIKFILLITVSVLPIFLFVDYHIVTTILKINKADAFKLITALFPLIFSFIIIIFNSIMASYKEMKENLINDIKTINDRTRRYNMIMIKAINRFNTLMNEYMPLIGIVDLLKRIDEFNSAIMSWESKSKEKVDVSNDGEFRSTLRMKLDEFIKNYDRKNTLHFANMELIRNYDYSFEDKVKIDNEDNLFIYTMRNYITISKADRALFSTYDGILEGNYDKRIIDKTGRSFGEFREYFDANIRNDQIEVEQFKSKLYGIFLDLFAVIEYYSKEILLLELFQESLFNNYSKYYNKEAFKYHSLDLFIIFEVLLLHNDKLIYDKKLIYDYYSINDV